MINIQELDGSPELDFDRSGGSALRTVLIDYNDLDAFLEELFPEDPYSGYLYAASFPGFPWLVVDSIKIRPFGRLWGTGENPAKYDFWKINVGYRVSNVDWKMASGPGLDPNGPGGDEGSSGGEGASQGVKYLTHKIKGGGEFLLAENEGLIWTTHADGTPTLDDDDKLGKVLSDVGAGKIVPLQEHVLTWSYVTNPPWQNLRDSLGKVNDAKFAGAPKGTLLFVGYEATREYSTRERSYWNLTYNLSEKNNGTVAEPKGWNYFFRKTGAWEFLARKGTGLEKGIYDKVNMRKIFQLS